MYRVLALGALAIAALPGSAAAETINCTSLRSLPAVIDAQGTYCMTQDLATAISTGAAVQITVNNVVLDCNGFKLGGLSAGAATQAYGIYAAGKSNLTVRNCNVRGFLYGITLVGDGVVVPSGQVVEDNRLDGNTRRGITVDSDASVVRRNLVTDTGGNPYAFTGIAIAAFNGTDVLDNTVDGVTEASDTATTATGVYVAEGGGSAVVGNRVRNVTSSMVARGYLSIGTADTTFRDNIASIAANPGASVGYLCGAPATLAKDNVSAGFDTALQSCVDGGGNTSIVYP